MNKKILIFIILFIIFIAGFFIFSDDKQNKIRIGACPTCFEMAKEINNKEYEIIKTASTAESLALLEDQKVDIILAGRKLKPHEPQMDGILLKKGYSLLSKKGAVVYIDQLKNYDVYTDLDAELLKSVFSLQKIKEVSNVYKYLDKGIVITSWENTDYTKAEIVHVLKENGKRVKLSRQPTIYCPNVCGKEAQEVALLIK